MSSLLIAVVTVIYAGTAVSLWLENNKGMALCFLGYCVANVGLILSLQKS